MQHEGKEESEEMSSPEVCESMPHGDAVRFLTWTYNSMKSAVMGYPPHYVNFRLTFSLRYV